MFRDIMLVALGGAVGSVVRYLLSHVVQESAQSVFPFGTLTVNVIGCFIIGFVGALAASTGAISDETKLLLTTGFCGGLTTFSTFMNESVSLCHTSSLLISVAYIGLSVALGLLAAVAGMSIAKLL